GAGREAGDRRRDLAPVERLGPGARDEPERPRGVRVAKAFTRAGCPAAGREDPGPLVELGPARAGVQQSDRAVPAGRHVGRDAVLGAPDSGGEPVGEGQTTDPSVRVPPAGRGPGHGPREPPPYGYDRGRARLRAAERRGRRRTGTPLPYQIKGESGG